MTSAIMLAMDESTKWILAPLVLPIFLWALWRKLHKLRTQSYDTGSSIHPKGRLSVSLRAIASLWYRFFGLVLIVILGNSLLYGFDELLDTLSWVRPVGWLVIAAAFAPGPLAHWLAIRLKR